MTYLEKHNASGLKAGDLVLVERRAIDHEQDWNNTWQPDMDKSIGKRFKIITDEEDYGFMLSGTYWRYPYFILKKQDDQDIFLEFT